MNFKLFYSWSKVTNLGAVDNYGVRALLADLLTPDPLVKPFTPGCEYPTIEED